MILKHLNTFNSLSEFLGKSWTFIFDWNLERGILKLKKTPFALIKEKCRIFKPGIGNFQPFVLDEIRTLVLPHYSQKVCLMLSTTSVLSGGSTLVCKYKASCFYAVIARNKS